MSVFSGSSFKIALRSSGLDSRLDVLTAPSRLSRTTNNEHCSNTGTHTPPVGLTSQIAIARTEQISLINTRDARSYRDGTGEVVAVIGATATTSPSGVPGRLLAIIIATRARPVKGSSPHPAIKHPGASHRPRPRTFVPARAGTNVRGRGRWEAPGCLIAGWGELPLTGRARVAMIIASSLPGTPEGEVVAVAPITATTSPVPSR